MTDIAEVALRADAPVHFKTTCAAFINSDIRTALQEKRIRIDPFDEDCLQPSSVDLHLDREFRVFHNYRYDRIGNLVNKQAALLQADPLMNLGAVENGGSDG